MHSRRQQDRRKTTQRGVTGYDRRKGERRRTLRKDTLMFATVEPSEYAALDLSYLDFTVIRRK
jgi:hypothetical protein